MKQVICRITTKSPDAEVLIKDGEKQLWKSVKIEDLIKTLDKYSSGSKKGQKLRLLDPRIIARNDCSLLFKEPEHRRRVFYSGTSFEINFPPCLYFVRFTSRRIMDIDCYTFFEWDDANTDLYLFPMPNMTSSERMCIGTADRTIVSGKVIEAVERIVDAEYTHDHVDNLKRGRSTLAWFRYLKTNKVKKKDLKNPVRKLSDLVEGQAW